jgi:predicted site-specific integrase-resolvase
MPSEVSSPTARAAIYARYSSDNQREASIEDQVEVCRRRAELQGWEIVEVYPDRALSGASRFRPAFHVNRQVPCTTPPHDRPRAAS